MSTFRVLLSALLLLQLSSVALAATDCSQYYIGDTCTDCLGYSDCGWMSCPQGTDGSYVNSSCVSGNAYGPKNPAPCSNGQLGTWYNSQSIVNNQCGNECNWACGLPCDNDQWCETFSIGTPTTYSCSCNANPFRLLGMALVTFVLVTVFVVLAICVGIICCCYFACRTPTTIIQQQPVVVAAPGQMFYQPQQQYQFQPQQQMNHPSYVTAQPYQQPLLAAQHQPSEGATNRV